MCVQITKYLIKCDFRVLYLFCIRSPWSFLESTALLSQLTAKAEQSTLWMEHVQSSYKVTCSWFQCNSSQILSQQGPQSNNTANYRDPQSTMEASQNPRTLAASVSGLFFPPCLYILLLFCFFLPPTFAISNTSQ